MTAEREQMTKSLETLATKMEEVNQGLWEKEIAVQKTMAQVSFRLGQIQKNVTEDLNWRSVMF